MNFLTFVKEFLAKHKLTMSFKEALQDPKIKQAFLDSKVAKPKKKAPSKKTTKETPNVVVNVNCGVGGTPGAGTKSQPPPRGYSNSNLPPGGGGDGGGGPPPPNLPIADAFPIDPPFTDAYPIDDEKDTEKLPPLADPLTPIVPPIDSGVDEAKKDEGTYALPPVPENKTDDEDDWEDNLSLFSTKSQFSSPNPMHTPTNPIHSLPSYQRRFGNNPAPAPAPAPAPNPAAAPNPDPRVIAIQNALRGVDNEYNEKKQQVEDAVVQTEDALQADPSDSTGRLEKQLEDYKTYMQNLEKKYEEEKRKLKDNYLSRIKYTNDKARKRINEADEIVKNQSSAVETLKRNYKAEIDTLKKELKNMEELREVAEENEKLKKLLADAKKAEVLNDNPVDAVLLMEDIYDDGTNNDQVIDLTNDEDYIDDEIFRNQSLLSGYPIYDLYRLGNYAVSGIRNNVLPDFGSIYNNSNSGIVQERVNEIERRTEQQAGGRRSGQTGRRPTEAERLANDASSNRNYRGPSQDMGQYGIGGNGLEDNVLQRLQEEVDRELEEKEKKKKKKKPALVISGGSLEANTLQQIFHATYNRDQDPGNGYLRDNDLSTETTQVFYNPDERKYIVSHRGTEGVSDWGNNLAFASSEELYKKTDRYKSAKRTQNEARKKYHQDNQLITVGHSQGGLLAELLGGKDEIITLNKATAPHLTNLIKPRKKKNQTDIRSEGDFVSYWRSPFRKERRNTITIKKPKKGSDPLTEHSTEILQRLGNKKVGRN